MFAAQCGARRVIGVDCSSIVHMAQKIVKRNGLDDIVQLRQARVEELTPAFLGLAEGELVDVVISEWMGYGLYFENMFSSVIVARDRFLKGYSSIPDSVFSGEKGVMMPAEASLFIEAASFSKPLNDASISASGVCRYADPLGAGYDKWSGDRVGFWRDVYGLDMSDLAPLHYHEAQVDRLEPADLISDRTLFHRLDLAVATNKELDFVAPFRIQITRSEILAVFAITFDVLFSGMHTVVPLSTSVSDKDTHWKHTLLWLSPENRPSAPVNAGDTVTGSVRYQRMKENKRDYQITVRWNVNRLSGADLGSTEDVSKVEAIHDTPSQKMKSVFAHQQIFFLCA